MEKMKSVLIASGWWIYICFFLLFLLVKLYLYNSVDLCVASSSIKLTHWFIDCKLEYLIFEMCKYNLIEKKLIIKNYLN